MKSEIEIEQILERLGNAWPAGGSLVEGVLRGIESAPAPLKSRRSRWPVTKSLLATAASLAVVTAVWWTLRGDNTLYAQALDAIQRARTFQMITTVQPDADKPAERVAESWYERGIGFREEVGSQVRLGNQKNFWSYVKDTKLAIRSKSRGIDDIVDRMLDNETLQTLKGAAQIERHPAGDQIVDGRPCQAHLLTKLRTDDPQWKAGNRRVLILMDDRSRMVRTLTEARSEDRWVVQLTTDWKYDVPVDRALFEPDFGDDVKIVYLDAVFDEFVDLDKAVHREERSGLVYAIHRVERFENGGIFLVSSVRGTAETLKKYPVTRWRVAPGLFAAGGPAVNYEASPQGDGYFRIDLAKAGHQGIDLRWWVLVPRGKPSTHFDVAPGKVKLPLGVTPHGEFAKANFADERGVIQHLTWDVVLDLPEPKVLPTVDAIARQIYADQIALEAVPFTLLDMGPKDHVKQFSEPIKTTAAEFSKAVAGHIEWWKKNDIEWQLEGQFTSPHNLDPADYKANYPAMGFMYEPLVDDATLVRVAKHGSLKRLYLKGTKITDAGLRHLAGLQELRDLGLENTSITDAGLKELEGLSALRNLDVQNTKVTPDGVARLKAAIPALQVKQ